MALSPTGIIPEELLFPARRGAVMAFLINLPIEGDLKEELLIGWAKSAARCARVELIDE